MLRATKCFATSHPILATSLIRAQYHAAKFYATPHTILYATKFFVTPQLILGMLFHVPKVLAIETKSDAKVITTGETTTPSLLVTALPSINDLFAGGSCAHNLL